MRILESLIQDLGYAWRAMRRAPVVAAAAVLSIALGIGANTAIFSLINAVMLRSLRVRSPQELVQIGWTSKAWPERFVATTSGRGVELGGQNVHLPFSLETYQQIRARSTTLAGVAGRMDLFTASAVVVAQGRADTARGNLVSGNFFDVLGVRPAAGRLFADSDDREGADPVVVLSNGYWTRRFGADPRVIGTRLLINGTSYSVAGVADAAFTGLDVGTAPDLYIPLHDHPLVTAKEGFKSNVLHTPSWWWVEIIGRRKPGVSGAQVHAELAALFRESIHPIGSAPVRPEDYPSFVLGSPQAIKGGIRYQFSQPLVVLMTIVGFVLLIACANVANLLMTRAVARRKEMAMRQALGAGARRLFRQTMVESLLLSAMGGAFGLAIAQWGSGVLVKLVSSERNPLALDVHADARVVLFLIALSFLVGLLFGVAPAIQASRVDVNTLLQASSGGMKRSRGGQALVVFQVAASLALLIGAGLYVRTLWNLRHVALGFEPQNVLSFRIAARRGGYEGDRLLQLANRLDAMIEDIPGVRSVAYAHLGLLNRIQTTGGLEFLGEKPDKSKNALILFISPAFFDTMQIPLMAGRPLTDRDGANAPRVALVNESLAREYLNRASPVGRQITYFMDHFKSPIEIVGMVKDAKYRSVTAPMQPVLYLPYAQNLQFVQEASFVVRTVGDPRAAVSAIREQMRRIDPDLPIFGVTTETALRDENLRDQTLMADLAACFAVLALFLATIGLYGVVSYSVSRRTPEIGIRMALGAGRSRVLSHVLRESLALVGVGMALGIGVAWGAARLIASQLYGLQPRDPATMILACAVIFLVTIAASLLPARRASRIDPMTALRHE